MHDFNDLQLNFYSKILCSSLRVMYSYSYSYLQLVYSRHFWLLVSDCEHLYYAHSTERQTQYNAQKYGRTTLS